MVLVHLHSQWIVHGDLKAVSDSIPLCQCASDRMKVNVLVDNGGKAVLCDFGLARVKADATSRTACAPDAASIVGSRNWMAPERILGGSLKKPCGIYAFGHSLR